MFDRQTGNRIKGEIVPSDTIRLSSVTAPAVSLTDVNFDRPITDLINLKQSLNTYNKHSIISKDYRKGVVQKCVIFPRKYILAPYKDRPDQYIAFLGISLGMDYSNEFLYCGMPMEVWFPLKSFFTMLRRSNMSIEVYGDYPVIIHFVKHNKMHYELLFVGILNDAKPNQAEYKAERILYKKDGYKHK